jgi:serine/threonine protein kinase
MDNSWHQDVKPANILVKSADSKSPYQVQFKLADLGLSHFRKNAAGEDPADADSRGTRTYGRWFLGDLQTAFGNMGFRCSGMLLTRHHCECQTQH